MQATAWIDRPSVPVDERVYVAWWRNLGDPYLAQLIEAGLERNLSIRQALSRVDEARALRDRAAGRLVPEIAADASVTSLQQSLNANPGLDQIPGFQRQFEIYDVGGSLSWQIDLWGQTRRAIEARDAQVEATVAQVNGARRAFVAELATTYFDLAGHQAERAALLANIADQERGVQLAQLQLREGAISRAELLVLQTELARTQTELGPLDATIARTALALGVLVGDLPESEYANALSGVPLPPLLEVPVGLRADLLRRRPDIAAAERRLAASTAQIGVAEAELFPRLALNAEGGFSSVELGSLFEGDSTSFSIVPFLSWRIFDGGQVRAEIRLAEAEARTAALAYESSVLEALQEAETAIARYDVARRTLAQSETALSLAAENVRLAQLQFDYGAIDQLRLLDARRAARSAERGRVIAYRNVALAMASLYAALGGGWQAVVDASDVPSQPNLGSDLP